jgi:hypothetical protein
VCDTALLLIALVGSSTKTLLISSGSPSTLSVRNGCELLSEAPPVDDRDFTGKQSSQERRRDSIIRLASETDRDNFMDEPSSTSVDQVIAVEHSTAIVVTIEAETAYKSSNFKSKTAELSLRGT